MPVRLPVPRRYDRFGQLASERFTARPTEHFFGPSIPIGDFSVCIHYKHGAQRRIEDRTHALFTLSQSLVLLVDLREHVIEGIGQQAQFIVGHFLRPDGIIAAIRDGLGGLSQGQDRLRNLLLESSGKHVGHEERTRDHQPRNAAVESEPLIHGPHVGLQVERAQTLVAALNDRLKPDQMRVLEPRTIFFGRSGKGLGWQLIWIFRELFPVLVVQGCGHNMRLSF